jgi:CheY-like chemotaxis protein
MSGKQHILIVDDDVQLVDSVKTLLESVGYQVSYAYQSQKGIEMARETPPDLILLDVMFAGPPGPDGFEVARELHADPQLREAPIIILSGVKKVLDVSFEVSPDEVWMPVKAFLEKPVKPEKLLAEIEEVLGPRQ